MQIFTDLLRDSLATQKDYKVLRLNCPDSRCSAGNMTPADLVQTARRAGARLLIYGGIHKMSTLVQWGDIQVVDLEKDKLLLDRMFTFRGDTESAFRQAAKSIAETLSKVMPKS